MKPYTGKKLRKPYKKDGKTLTLEAYLPDDKLVDAVNLAIFLKRPLLIMGDPGCGKTRLSEAVAFDLYQDKYEEFLFRWNVKSTSKAKDGQYRYKALKKLRDAQTDELEDNEEEYIAEGMLWKAFDKSKVGNRSVLLIDEIDKADMDFPNDLLLELDKSEFYVPELDKTIRAEEPPIVFITSNNEHHSKLSPAFLRRCLYHHIEFPEKEQLKKILLKQFEIEEEENALVNKVVEAFLKVRAEQESKEEDKKVSTSELIDWFKIIKHCEELNETTANDYEKSLKSQLVLLGTDKIPFKQVLLKNWNNHISKY